MLLPVLPARTTSNQESVAGLDKRTASLNCSGSNIRLRVASDALTAGLTNIDLRGLSRLDRSLFILCLASIHTLPKPKDFRPSTLESIEGFRKFKKISGLAMYEQTGEGRLNLSFTPCWWETSQAPSRVEKREVPD